MKNNAYIKSKWVHFKVSTLSASIIALVMSSIPTQISASDIDIYQAGGTGATSIYMMLDKSGSMDYSEGFLDDYGYIYEEKKPFYNTNVCTLSDTIKVGNDYYYYVGPKNGGHYGPVGPNTVTSWSSGGWFVEDAAGDYKVITNVSNTSNNKCKINYTINRSVCKRILSDIDLHITFNNKNYNYVNKDKDGICYIDLSSFPNKTGSEKTKIDNIKKRVKQTCTDISGNETKYRCLSRMAKLREGLMKMIIDPSVDESKGFALGVYSDSTAETLLTFTEMNEDNKEEILGKIKNISALGGTPIGAAYKVASNEFDTSPYFNDKSKLECSGNGIYFMTDGEPSYDSTTFGYGTTSSYTKILPEKNASEFWNKIGYQAQYLKNSKFKIKTATVGFGSEYYFSTLPEDMSQVDCANIGTSGSNAQSLCKWGAKKSEIGSGGFYTVQSTNDLIKSLKQFISDSTVSIEGSTMGTSTIPIDALNTTQLQPYSYFPMFKPLIGSKEQLWAGNLKKFKVEDGTIVDINKNSVFEGNTIRKKLTDYWYSAGNTEDEYITWGGHLSRLKANNYPEAGENSTNLKRNLYININGTLEKVTNVLSENMALDNRHYLYGLLGFSKLKKEHLEELGSKEYTEQLSYLKSKLFDIKGYQMGSVIHSTPLLLTQKGALEIDKGVISSKDREDYILFGTTQGVLHVVKAGQQDTETPDAEGGKEVFSFVPNEFLTRQSKGFAESLAQERTDSVNTFFYGIDGPWVAHTEYEPLITDFYKKKDEEYVLDDDGNKIIESTRSALVVKPDSTKSHQYVYGGLRMGGDSYYALNLSDITKPELMFHIDPQKYKNSALPEDKSHPLAYMGQSWSKPTITYIKWNGKKKLVMIVGGGYDIKYEKPDFISSTSDPVTGNGVYIFDAENGKLLWWGSNRVDKSTDAENDNQGKLTKYASSSISGMTNSIPSRVKVIDRDGDGITDHLYVGDLGGKVFRIDLNPQHLIDKVKPQSFTLNAFTLADLGKRRFYEAPTFTIHKGNSTRYAVLTMGSGDRSSPLYTADDHTDWLVGLYDYTVTNSKLLPQTTITANNLKEIYNTSSVADNTEQSPKMGWYYPLPKTESEDKKNKYQSRILEEGMALANELYVSVFSPQNSTAKKDATECTGGITGQSTIYQFCLPDGECAGTTKPKNIGDLGPGIIGLTLGTGTKANQRTFIFNKKPDEKPDEFVTLNKLLPQRWFEYSPYKVKGKSE